MEILAFFFFNQMTIYPTIALLLIGLIGPVFIDQSESLPLSMAIAEFRLIAIATYIFWPLGIVGLVLNLVRLPALIRDHVPYDY